MFTRQSIETNKEHKFLALASFHLLMAFACKFMPVVSQNIPSIIEDCTIAAYNSSENGSFDSGE